METRKLESSNKILKGLNRYKVTVKIVSDEEYSLLMEFYIIEQNDTLMYDLKYSRLFRNQKLSSSNGFKSYGSNGKESHVFTFYSPVKK